jgi:hypothetical protein
VVAGEGLKPLTTSQTPSENSHAAPGITGSPASPVKEECCSNSVANTAIISRGPPMSPIKGMTRGTSRARYIKESSSSALMPGIRVCESRNVQSQTATCDAPTVTSAAAFAPAAPPNLKRYIACEVFPLLVR